MKVLVTGGTGVIGAGVIPELLRRGHEVRLLSRHAEAHEASSHPHVEPFNANIDEPASLRGAADGCDAVIHITGIVDEAPPEVTFARVNVEGTQSILAEAERAGARRFIFISSLGADRGKSDYHVSKRKAEELVEASALDWTVVRPGNVFGPGDEIISTLLKLVRALPAVPMVGWGQQRFQPIWFDDLGKALALLVENDEHARQILEIAGDDIVTPRELIEKFDEITGRSSVKVPVPASLVSAAATIAEKVQPIGDMLERAGLEMPISTNKLQMLLEENFIRDGSANALHSLGVKPTPLDKALRQLADELPELLPQDGVGTMERKRFQVEIDRPKHDAVALMKQVREHINDVMGIEFSAEPGAPEEVEQNATLTGAIPGRGHVQVRAAEVEHNEMTFLTVEGHPLAGAVTFRAADLPDKAVRFTVEVNARAANFLDWVALRTVGQPMQNANWRTVATRVAELSGGKQRGEINETSETLSEGEAERTSTRIAELAKQS